MRITWRFWWSHKLTQTCAALNDILAHSYYINPCINPCRDILTSKSILAVRWHFLHARLKLMYEEANNLKVEQHASQLQAKDLLICLLLKWYSARNLVYDMMPFLQTALYPHQVRKGHNVVTTFLVQHCTPHQHRFSNQWYVKQGWYHNTTLHLCS